MINANENNKNSGPSREEAKKAIEADTSRLAALGGEPLAGSGFEGEEPEPGFTETGAHGPASGLATDSGDA